MEPLAVAFVIVVALVYCGALNWAGNHPTGALCLILAVVAMAGHGWWALAGYCLMGTWAAFGWWRARPPKAIRPIDQIAARLIAEGSEQ